ncbi:nitrate reductase molybdenum cofactor assembly chaperone [Populibacterium corticicola]|uniref:Nitrate reductase molybdenum cofactor assembly chaperone n=1 Tax=Populibacterium corticicola TaxID=1812826 RepID=A0ABW5XFB1_9MICO
MSAPTTGRKPVAIPLFRRSKRRDLVEVPGRADVLALISVLLGYPDEEFDSLRADLAQAVAALPQSAAATLVQKFWGQFSHVEPSEARRHYVETFDLRRNCSLFLTYYLHGDTRQRGMSLLMFKQRYRAYGFTPPENELPDYLPMVLEFAATTGPGVGEGLLRMHRSGLEVIRTALRKRKTAYSLLFDAVDVLLGPITQKQLDEARQLISAGPPQDSIGLESPLAGYGQADANVPFGPPAYTCSERREPQ